METKYNDTDNRYLLLNTRNVPLAHVMVEGSLDGQTLTVRIVDNEMDGIAGHEVVRLLGMDNSKPLIQCRLVRQEGRRIVLQKLTLLDPKLRSDLRVPLHCDSFLYDSGEGGVGRCRIQFVDISCGGAAFYGPEGLEQREGTQIVLPITACPLVLGCKILHTQALRNNRALYAAKFLDLCNDEEKMIREAVFSLQLGSRSGHGHA